MDSIRLIIRDYFNHLLTNTKGKDYRCSML
jgi:hypothetical protein